MIVLPKGEKNKLTDEDKVRILDMKGIRSAYAVAEDFNVSHTMIYKIWKKNDRNQRKPDVFSRLDTQILLKMIPVFAKSKMKINLTEVEIFRIQQLSKEVL